MSQVVVAVPADRIEWGAVQAVGHGCMQTATLYQGTELVCQLTVQWPTSTPAAAVVCSTQGRHGGPQD